MIGQDKIKDKISRWKEIPRFIILNGPKGCGKKTLAKEIADKFNAQLIILGVKIDEIRDMIKLANEIDTNVIFLIDNGNKMSLGAENTLLKITEEAPNNTHIILAVENKDLLLPTIISRGEVFNFQDYNKFCFLNYISKNGLGEVGEFSVTTVYPNLSYLDILPLDKAKEFYDYCKLILDRIRTANGANAFKITEKIKIKEEQEGWDLYQFLFCLKKLCVSRLLNSARNADYREYNYCLEYSKILTELQRMLSNPLFNKAYILDKLVIDFKSVYFD